MKPKFLYHGSPRQIIGHKLAARKAKDRGKNLENEKNGVYATDVKRLAIIMAILTSKGVRGSSLDFGKGNSEGVVFRGWPKQEYVYLYVLSPKGFNKSTNINHQYVSFTSTKPIKIEKIKVRDYLHLIRRPKKQELEEAKVRDIINYGKISRLKSDSGQYGDSKEVHLVEYQGKKYILRICKDKEKALRYEELSRKLEKYGFLPKLLGARKNYVVYEYIRGRDCTKADSIKTALQIGKICAQINKIKNPVPYDPDERFFLYIGTFRDKKLIGSDMAKRIKKKYLGLKNKINPQIVMDANDVYPDNFRLKKGKVYLIDLDAIKPLFKGYGISKSFIRWFKKEKERNKLKVGYASIASIKFLTDEYLEFVYLNFFMRSIAIKLRLNKPINKEDIVKLNRLMEGKLK